MNVTTAREDTYSRYSSRHDRSVRICKRKRHEIKAVALVHTTIHIIYIQYARGKIVSSKTKVSNYLAVNHTASQLVGVASPGTGL